MNKYSLSRFVVFFSLLLSLSSCEAIGAIFKAGVWSGVLLVVLAVALVIFIITRLGNRNK